MYKERKDGEGKRKQIVGGAGEEVEGSHGGRGEGVEDVEKEGVGVVDDTYIFVIQSYRA